MAGVDIPPLSGVKDPALERWARKVSDAFNTVVRDMQKLSGSYYVWDKGSLSIPQNTTIAGAEEIVFESNFSGNGVLLLTVVGAEGGVNVALNGTELGELKDTDTSSEIVHKVAVSNLVNGLNSLKIWDDAGDTAELRKVVHSTVKAEATRVNDNLFDREDRWPAVLDTLYTDGFYIQEKLRSLLYTDIESGSADRTSSILDGTVSWSVTADPSDAITSTTTVDSLTLPTLTWDKDREWRTRVQFDFTGGSYSNTNASVAMGQRPTSSAQGMGFRLQGSTALVAYVRNTSGITSAATGITIATGSSYLLEIDYVAGSKADFYVDGALVATITGNFPTGTVQADLYFGIEMDNTGTPSGTRAITAAWLKFAQHP